MKCQYLCQFVHIITNSILIGCCIATLQQFAYSFTYLPHCYNMLYWYIWWRHTRHKTYILLIYLLQNAIIVFIRLRLNVALTHQNRSCRDSESKENIEAQKRKQRGGNDMKRTATTKTTQLKKGRSS